ncbi:MAG: hypothetical protein SNJ59_16105 [Aggregatilineales bacterium]
MTASANYPDFLGLITKGARANIGVVQAALAVRPRVVRAGKPFEVILLLQNAADVDVDAIITLTLPEMDARRQHGSFMTKTKRLVVGMAAAEFGYAVMPASSLPTTAPSDSYRLTVEVEAKPLRKPRRIRDAEGGGPVDPDLLPPAAQAEIEALRGLSYATYRSKLGRGPLELSFGLITGGISKIAELKPGWVSVCRLIDYGDARPLLHQYRDLLLTTILLRLRRAELYKPLLETVKSRFKEAGFPLYDPEAALIAKLLTIILEYSAPRQTAHGYASAGRYAIVPLLEKDPLTLEQAPTLPHWLQGMLRLLDRDARVADHTVQVITRLVFDDLLYDAALHGFELVEAESGVDLGSPAELAAYARALVTALRDRSGLDFNRVYLPLVLGGVIINEQMLVSKDAPADLLRAVAVNAEQRATEAAAAGEDNDNLVDLINLIIDRTGQKYGFRAT